jgi:hypothetical protein
MLLKILFDNKFFPAGFCRYIEQAKSKKMAAAA